MTSTASVVWPAMLRLTGIDELTYIHDQHAWLTDNGLHGGHYLDGDVLIDADGTIHTLQQREGDCVVPVASGHLMPLEELLDAVRAHAAQTGACCVAKFSTATPRAAIEAVGQSQRSR